MDMTLTLLAAGLAPVVAVGAILITRLRAWRGDAYSHFRCPACRQRIRFQARKAGRSALCPNCYALATLPRPSRPGMTGRPRAVAQPG
jgi:hypothetical protein